MTSLGQRPGQARPESADARHQDRARRHECLHYDETGQIVTGSFLDYGLPRANIIPPIVTGNHNVPTDSNPLGAKGGAETGIVGCLPATIGAIRDALEPYDIADIPLPATPDVIWRLIDQARKAPLRTHENAKA